MNITTKSPEKLKKCPEKVRISRKKLWILPLYQTRTHGPERKIQFWSHWIRAKQAPTLLVFHKSQNILQSSFGILAQSSQCGGSECTRVARCSFSQGAVSASCLVPPGHHWSQPSAVGNQIGSNRTILQLIDTTSSTSLLLSVLPLPPPVFCKYF